MTNIRLLSEIAFEALEKVNRTISKFKSSDIGVFVAAGEGYIIVPQLKKPPTLNPK